MERVVAVLASVVVFCSLLNNHGTEAVKLPQQEADLENQYKLFRKPSVKTIKSGDGEIYDCVDFYKQHAFDHPLLQNHSFHPEMRPSSIPKWTKVETSPQKNNEKISLDSIKLKDGGCPKGTVPIRRISKDDYIRINHFTQQHLLQTKGNGVPNTPSGVNYAVIQTKTNPGTTLYNGVGAELSLHNFPVGPTQYSAGEMIIRNGNDMIRVGWMVNPTLYNDNKTHLFQYLDAGDTHCFNTMCSGFVSVRPDLPIDMVLQPVSIYGKITYTISLFVYQDSKSGIWWLQMNDDVLGWWPQKIFKELAHYANYIAVGGQTFTPPGEPLPPMGDGNYPTLVWSTKYFGQFRQWIVVDTQEQQVDPQDTEGYSTDEVNYAAKDMGHSFKGMGRIVFYGG